MRTWANSLLRSCKFKFSLEIRKAALITYGRKTLLVGNIYAGLIFDCISRLEQHRREWLTKAKWRIN